MLWCVLCGTFGCEQHWWGLMPCDTNYYHTCCGALADDILSQKLKPAGHLKPPQTLWVIKPVKPAFRLQADASSRPAS
jgi:hypothetical protein